MRFLWFIPEEFLLYIVLVLLIGLIVGLVRLRSILFIVAVFVFLPFLEPVLGVLPEWIQLAALLLMVLALLRDVLAFSLGDRAADHAMGEFVGYLLRLMLWAFLMPFRTAGWIFRTTFNLLLGENR